MLFVRAGRATSCSRSRAPTIADAVDKTQRSLAGIVVRRHSRSSSRCRWRAASPAAAPRAAAERRGQRVPAAVRLRCWSPTSSTGPRSQVMIVGSRYSLDARRAGGVPRRACCARGWPAAASPSCSASSATMRGDDAAGGARRTLGDPTLVLAYRLPESPRLRRRGRPRRCWCRRSPPTARTAPVEREGREVAALVYDASLDDDPELVEAVRAAAAIALENERLHAESEARLAEVQASRERIVAAGDAERRRLERNLHDGAQQRLVALVAAAAAAPGPTSGATPPTAEQLVDDGERRARRSRSQELRELARGIHPAVARPRPRRRRSSRWRRARRCRPRCPATRRSTLPEPVELAAYFVACEALANVGKYAAGDRGVGARCRARRRRRRDRDRRRRRRRRRRRARLGPARAGRPRRGARRAAARRQPARARGPWSPRSCRARRDRRRQPARARGHRLAAAARRDRGGRRRRPRRGAAARGRRSTSPTSRSSTSGCRRRTPTRACAPRTRSARATREIGIVILSQHVEVGIATRAAGREPGAARLPAQGPRRRRRRLRRHAAARRRRRLGARPAGRLPAAGARARRRPAGRRSPRASARCSSWSPRAARTRRSPSGSSISAARRPEARDRASSPSSACRPTRTTPPRPRRARVPARLTRAAGRPPASRRPGAHRGTP